MEYYSSIKKTYKIVVYIFLYELRKGEDAISPSPYPCKSRSFFVFDKARPL